MSAPVSGPRLVTVAHGTRQVEGNIVAAALTRAAGARLGLPAVASYVELCPPLLGDVLRAGPPAGLLGVDPPRVDPPRVDPPRVDPLRVDPWGADDGPTLVVPLLLSTGYHLRVDLPAAVADAPGRVELGGPLGPDPLLASAQVERLLAAGAVRGQPVTMVAAGSRDPAATADLAAAADLLSGQWGAPVRLATLAGLGPRVLDVVRPGDAVSPYLLSPGHFADRARELGRSAGAEAVAEVIGPHPDVVELVASRARALLGLSLAGSR
ncbi:sirohydrochlorin chelatase [Nocardioides sp. DS6]|uniref:Sirohydrochlorin chelatase n=1 Tax=Nocardioides eburneus TaxID=3231482 RepID=A0ABV3SWE3_9ACTN